MQSMPRQTLFGAISTMAGMEAHPRAWAESSTAFITATRRTRWVSRSTAAADAYQYSTNIQISPPNTTDKFHPANVQAQIDERQWAQLASKNYLWADIVWQMFDMASSGRNEGDTSGINDKGLVTRDRTTKKDSYYFYQAAWNDPSRDWANQNVLHISESAWADRTSPGVTVTASSNLGTRRFRSTVCRSERWSRW